MSYSNAEIIAMKREFYLSSFYHFAKYCLKYKEMTKQAHGPIAKALQSDTLRKLLCVPRGCFKSSVGTVAYTMWRLLHDPNLRILIDSEKYANSKNFLREITAHYVNNQEFIECFGNWIGPLWNEGEAIVAFRTKALKEPSIACSGIGAGKTSQHYDVIIADDLSSYLNTINPDVAEKTIDHYRQYISLLEPNGTIVIIGTRYSSIDIIGFVLKNELGIEDIKDLKRILSEKERD